MSPFSQVSSVAAPLAERDVDTDIIFPARYLTLTDKKGLGRYAFYERRYDDAGKPHAGFSLNRDVYKGAEILVAGSNFGCGSSREHAVWALADLDIRCVISDSFGEIFYANCLKNGMLPAIVDARALSDLTACAERAETLTVDLIAQEIRTADGATVPFQIEDWRREALLNGWDEISTIIQTRSDQIGAFEDRQRAAKPWLYAEE